MKLFALAPIFLSCSALAAQDLSFRGKVEVVHRSSHKTGSSDVVVWLTSTHPIEATLPSAPTRLVQKDKRFSPHLVAIPVGSEIEFPNQDSFFHDVFSIYRGKPFDLGLYESGTSRKIKFSQPGVSYIFCNIHPEMSAAIVAVSTPYFAVTGADGGFQIPHVKRGHYRMEFWYEFASDGELNSLTRELDIEPETAPVALTLHSSDVAPQHMDKYGQEYTHDKPKSY